MLLDFRQVTPEKLLLAAPRGYCAGVDRAVQTVERALELHGAARLRAQGDRPQQARRRAAARARRDLRRRARRLDPRGRDHGLLRPRRVAGRARRRRAPRPADDRRDVPAGHQGPPRGGQVRRRGLHDRADRPRRATRRSRARPARRPTTSCSCRPRRTSTRSRSPIPTRSPTSRRPRCRSTRRARSSTSLREKLPEHHRAAHRRHLLRDDQPPVGGQADGRAVRPRARHRLDATRRTPSGWSTSPATTAPRRT